MSNPLNTLLAIDKLALLTGNGLQPRLRVALQANARFATKLAGPIPTLDPTDLPDVVAVFPEAADLQRWEL